MHRKLNQIAADALKLPASLRAQLAQKLISSLDEPSEEENLQLWAEEAERRYEALRKGAVRGEPAGLVFRRVRAALR